MDDEFSRGRSDVPREFWAVGTFVAFVFSASFIFFAGVPGKKFKISVKKQMQYERNISMFLVACAFVLPVVVMFEGEQPAMEALRWQHTARAQAREKKSAT